VTLRTWSVSSRPCPSGRSVHVVTAAAAATAVESVSTLGTSESNLAGRMLGSIWGPPLCHLFVSGLSYMSTGTGLRTSWKAVTRLVRRASHFFGMVMDIIAPAAVIPDGPVVIRCTVSTQHVQCILFVMFFAMIALVYVLETAAKWTPHMFLVRLKRLFTIFVAHRRLLRAYLVH
jgi:hypothetical protein